MPAGDFQTKIALAAPIGPQLVDRPGVAVAKRLDEIFRDLSRRRGHGVQLAVTRGNPQRIAPECAGGGVLPSASKGKEQSRAAGARGREVPLPAADDLPDQVRAVAGGAERPVFDGDRRFAAAAGQFHAEDAQHVPTAFFGRLRFFRLRQPALITLAVFAHHIRVAAVGPGANPLGGQEGVFAQSVGSAKAQLHERRPDDVHHHLAERPFHLGQRRREVGRPNLDSSEAKITANSGSRLTPIGKGQSQIAGGGWLRQRVIPCALGLIRRPVARHFVGPEGQRVLPRAFNSRDANLHDDSRRWTVVFVFMARPGDRQAVNRHNLAQVDLPPGVFVLPGGGLPVGGALAGDAIDAGGDGRPVAWPILAGGGRLSAYPGRLSVCELWAIPANRPDGRDDDEARGSQRRQA